VDQGEVLERWSYPRPGGERVEAEAVRRLLRRELQREASSATASRYPCSVPTST
jgi:hypothetical protein